VLRFRVLTPAPPPTPLPIPIPHAVGYGDAFPVTGWGKMIASVTFISGVMLLAIPISVISGNFHGEYAHMKRLQALKAEHAKQPAPMPLDPLGLLGVGAEDLAGQADAAAGTAGATTSVAGTAQAAGSSSSSAATSKALGIGLDGLGSPPRRDDEADPHAFVAAITTTAAAVTGGRRGSVVIPGRRSSIVATIDPTTGALSPTHVIQHQHSSLTRFRSAAQDEKISQSEIELAKMGVLERQPSTLELLAAHRNTLTSPRATAASLASGDAAGGERERGGGAGAGIAHMQSRRLSPTMEGRTGDERPSPHGLGSELTVALTLPNEGGGKSGGRKAGETLTPPSSPFSPTGDEAIGKQWSMKTAASILDEDYDDGGDSYLDEDDDEEARDPLGWHSNMLNSARRRNSKSGEQGDDGEDEEEGKEGEEGGEDEGREELAEAGDADFGTHSPRPAANLAARLASLAPVTPAVVGALSLADAGILGDANVAKVLENFLADEEEDEEGGLSPAEAMIEAQRRIDASWSEPFLRTTLNIVRNSRRALMSSVKSLELRNRENAVEDVKSFVEDMASADRGRLMLSRASKGGLA
jgi:hypothetical protein